MVQKLRMAHNEESAANAGKDAVHSRDSLNALLKTVAHLRAPKGCPWDKEQTHQSLRPFLVEETYETIEVLDQIKSPVDLKDPTLKSHFIEEWGDVLLQILLHAQIASESDPEITFEKIAASLNEKLIRRHPHVFGEVKADDSAAVMKNWDAIKKQEKAKSGAAPKNPALLDSIHKGLPPLPRTMKLIQKVTKVGFQWPDVNGPIDKLQEEVNELKEALSFADGPAPAQFLAKVESEIGDVLFSVCNIAYFMKLDPEAALRSTLRKFESRFGYVERELLKQGKALNESNLDEMDGLWNQAKKIEREQE
jgi:tetrapyrrole methylase family protein/MazG family protein